MILLKDLLTEIKNTCWDGYKQVGMKKKGGRTVPYCVMKEAEEITLESRNDMIELLHYVKDQSDALDESEYHGRSVPLNKPMRGDVKKFKVYVKNPNNWKDWVNQKIRNIKGHENLNKIESYGLIVASLTLFMAVFMLIEDGVSEITQNIIILVVMYYIMII